MKIFNTRTLILVAVAIVVLFFLINILAKDRNQVVIPDLSQDKTAKDMGTHILSANPWFTCPDKNVIANWMRPFIESGKIGTGSNFTEDNGVILFEDNPLYMSCLITNAEKYIGEWSN